MVVVVKINTSQSFTNSLPSSNQKPSYYLSLLLNPFSTSHRHPVSPSSTAPKIVPVISNLTQNSCHFPRIFQLKKSKFTNTRKSLIKTHKQEFKNIDIHKNSTQKHNRNHVHALSHPTFSLLRITTTMPPSTTTVITLITLTILTCLPNPTLQQPDLDTDCTNRWIHIRHLPPPFNLDLLANCSIYTPLADDLCPYIPNHGLGLKTHNRSHSWFRTDPSLLELFFHRRMLEYPCLTTDPSSASAIYLPYYASLDSLRYLFGPDYNSSSQHGLHLYEFLKLNAPHIWKRNNGHDHFLVLARTAWDFSQPLHSDPILWGTSFLELPEFYNLTVLTYESRAYPWQEQAIPYPTSFHPPNVALLDSWIKRVHKSRRSTLMLFAGGCGISATANIRRSIRLECNNATSSADTNASTKGYTNVCEFVDCSNGICEHDPIRFMKPMLQSSFCLQPPGDTPTRRSTFDSILAGCIPVFFEELSAKAQYGWHLPDDKYEEFSVLIPKEDVVMKGVRVVDVLMAIPRAKVRRMRERVVEMMPRIIYRKHGSSLGLRTKKDAFDIAIEGTLERIKSRLKEVEDE